MSLVSGTRVCKKITFTKVNNASKSVILAVNFPLWRGAVAIPLETNFHVRPCEGLVRTVLVPKARASCLSVILVFCTIFPFFGSWHSND